MSADHPLDVGVVVGSTRPQRRAHLVADWVQARAGRHACLRPRVLDIADYELPLLDEPNPAAMGSPQREHTRRWGRAVEACDAFVFVVPEYNHSLPGALKNAIDFLFAEWRDKAAVAVGYGVHGGVRSVEHLRLVLAELSVAVVRTTPVLRLDEDFVDTRPAPSPRETGRLDLALDELTRWGGAFRALRGAGS